MPRGGHPKSGPPVKPAAVRAQDGTRIRDRHRQKGHVGTVGQVAAPADLTVDELEEWRYYAPLLHAAGRLTQEARGVLQNYCTCRATITRLRRQMGAPEYRDVLIGVTVDGAGQEHVKATPNPILLRLEKWILVAHTLENDLGLNPAMAMRMPSTSAATPEPAPVSDFFRGLSRVK
jgi:phage terminase small subunit